MGLTNAQPSFSRECEGRIGVIRARQYALFLIHAIPAET